MRLKLGTYSLKIKSFTAQELGLDTSSKELSFIIYQKVFHFWYIPIFPVEKHWKIKEVSTGKEITETTPKMRSAIDLQLLKKKSPIWSYSGSVILFLPILLVLGYVIFTAVDLSFDEINKSMDKNSRVSNKEQLVKTPQINDLYVFKIIEVDAVTDMNGHIAKYEPNPYFAPAKVNFTVNYLSADSVGFDIAQNQDFSIYEDDVKKEFKLSKNELVKAIQGYKDLDILNRPNVANGKSKMLTGIFEIERPTIAISSK